MKILKYLLYKEFIQIFRNKVIMRMIIFMPIFQLLILPWALTFEQKDILLSVVDNDRSSFSRKITEKLTSSGYFHLTDYSDTYNKALEAVDYKRADLIIEFPQGFENQFIRGEKPKLMLTVNALNGQKGNIIVSYFSQIINSLNKDLMVEHFSAGIIDIKTYYRYNEHMKYQNFMVPGILVTLMSLIGGMLASLNIVKEKETGTIEQINVTPVPKYLFIISKLVPFWIIGLILLTIGLMVAWVVYGLFPTHNILNLYIFTFCYMVAFSGFGLIISNYSDTQQQAIFTIFFFIMIFILLSGLFTPISSMPEWAQTLTLFNPLRYFVEAVRLLFLKRSSFSDIFPQLKVILIFAIFLNTWAVISYRKTSG